MKSNATIKSIAGTARHTSEGGVANHNFEFRILKPIEGLWLIIVNGMNEKQARKQIILVEQRGLVQ